MQNDKSSFLYAPILYLVDVVLGDGFTKRNIQKSLNLAPNVVHSFLLQLPIPFISPCMDMEQSEWHRILGFVNCDFVKRSE